MADLVKELFQALVLDLLPLFLHLGLSYQPLDDLLLVSFRVSFLNGDNHSLRSRPLLWHIFFTNKIILLSLALYRLIVGLSDRHFLSDAAVGARPGHIDELRLDLLFFVSLAREALSRRVAIELLAQDLRYLPLRQRLWQLTSALARSVGESLLVVFLQFLNLLHELSLFLDVRLHFFILIDIRVKGKT